jgi:hypothetical protein
VLTALFWSLCMWIETMRSMHLKLGPTALRGSVAYSICRSPRVSDTVTALHSGSHGLSGSRLRFVPRPHASTRSYTE